MGTIERPIPPSNVYTGSRALTEQDVRSVYNTREATERLERAARQVPPPPPPPPPSLPGGFTYRETNPSGPWKWLLPLLMLAAITVGAWYFLREDTEPIQPVYTEVTTEVTTQLTIEDARRCMGATGSLLSDDAIQLLIDRNVISERCAIPQ